MGKVKSLGYQFYSSLQEINMQDSIKRTDIYNKMNSTDYEYVGKREFKQKGQTKEFIFSRRTAENVVEKSKTFSKFLKENYNIKYVKEITPEMAKAFLDSRNTNSQKTITAYKNMLYKLDVAIKLKFGCKGFYNETISNYKLDKENIVKTNSKRLYTDSQIKQILDVDSKYSKELKFMSVVGCRVHELCSVRVKNFDLKNMTVYIEGKGGRPSNRPILPTEINFIKELIKGKGQNEKVFNVPINEKETRSIIGSEIRRITKSLDLPISSKCHEFRKYAAQNYFKYLVNNCGYSVKDAEEITVSKLLSHGENREDLKKIYLRS
ncbi:MAG: tyrosine-type recombinase/integrase [Clostridia bacterium]|nr:tyrosine-type recombinase/integrase [Clostridia bacterium]